ncbi:hypothetical protein [Nocardia farcinica]
MPIRLPAPPHAGVLPPRADAPVDHPERSRREPADTRTSGVHRSSAATGSGHFGGPAVGRRTALRVAGAGTLGVLALGASAGCAEEPVHDPDPLAAQEALARADAAAATAAIALAPQRQTTLTTIAAQRTEHADALRAEVARVIGVYGDGTTPVHKTREPSALAATGTPVPGTAQPAAPPSLDQLREQLTRSAKAAADAAVVQAGYRAGLLASISAACAVHAREISA